MIKLGTTVKVKYKVVLGEWPHQVIAYQSSMATVIELDQAKQQFTSEFLVEGHQGVRRITLSADSRNYELVSDAPNCR